MLMAETRPSSRDGVTDWRRVVVEITQRIGPTPSRKKLKAASHGEGTSTVSALTTAATKTTLGPRPTTVPNAMRFITRVANSAPITIPTPYIVSTVPTSAAV